MQQLSVFMLPTLTHPHALAGQAVVVTDVLRATTTIAAALTSGAFAVLPCIETGEASLLQIGRRRCGTPAGRSYGGSGQNPFQKI